MDENTIEEKGSLAEDFFMKGFNCSQSVVAAVTAAEKTPFFRRKQLPNLSHNLQIDYT